MKTIITFATLALLAAPVWAHDQDKNPDQKQSITNEHGSHTPHKPGDSHAPEKGSGDSYGSILKNKESHTPHKPGDTHAPEKGEGDAYGQVYKDMPKKK
ncbi:MAG: hypothetical protein ABL868_04090 [Sulfuriferula sp.]